MEERELHKDFRDYLNIRYYHQVIPYEKYLQKEILKFQRRLAMLKELKKKHKIKVRELKERSKLWDGMVKW